MYYAFDKDAALSADSSNNRISEKGKYTGKFTRAQRIISRSSTEGIDFDFVTDDGKRARFALYTRKADGTTIYGYKQLMAILTCMGQKGLAEPQPIPARLYDYDAGKEIEEIVPQFTELLNKPIGLLLHMEEYRKQDGEKKWRPGLSHAFQTNTGLMTAEILDRKVTPELLPKVLLTLRDRPIKEESPSGYNAYEAAKNGTGGFNDAEDIPF